MASLSLAQSTSTPRSPPRSPPTSRRASWLARAKADAPLELASSDSEDDDTRAKRRRTDDVEAATRRRHLCHLFVRCRRRGRRQAEGMRPRGAPGMRQAPRRRVRPRRMPVSRERVPDAAGIGRYPRDRGSRAPRIEPQDSRSTRPWMPSPTCTGARRRTAALSCPGRRPTGRRLD